MNEPIIVSGSYLDAKGARQEYAYSARRSTIFDEELINDANRRALEHRRRTGSSAQSAGAARPGGDIGSAPSRSRAGFA